jgi:protein involved in polysaccharide export with SLBB domain
MNPNFDRYLRTVRQPLSASALCIAVAVAGGCSSGVTVSRLQPEEIPTMQAAGNFPHGDYRIEPGDTIDIRFPFHREMDQREIVRPDGTLSGRNVGELQVAGLSTVELEERLRQQTSTRLKDPQVEVTVIGFAPRSIYVTGEVGRPGLIPYRKGITPLQAVADAGGFRETALIESVVLIRSARDADRFVSRSLDLREVVHEGADQPLELAPRDVIYVPKTRIAQADLWVDQHVTRLFPFIRGTSTSLPLGF